MRKTHKAAAVANNRSLNADNPDKGVMVMYVTLTAAIASAALWTTSCVAVTTDDGECLF